MLTVSADDRILLWSLRDGRPTGPARRYHMVPGGNGIGPTDASLSPDGRTLAITSPLGIDIGDVASLRRRTRLPDAGKLRVIVDFTPDGESLVVGSAGGWVRLWSTKTWQPAAGPIDAHVSGVHSQSISPDGSTLATGSIDGMVRLFDRRTQRPLGAPLKGLPSRPLAPLFTSDGAALLALTDTGRGYRWDVRPAVWARHACAVAGRRLTRAEFDNSLPGHPYAPAC